MDSGQIPYRMNGSRRLILVADIETWLDRLPIVKPGPKSVGPLLPAEDRALARQRAVKSGPEPDFSLLYDEHFELLRRDVSKERPTPRRSSTWSISAAAIAASISKTPSRWCWPR
jgi:hypothetical protein